MAKINEDRLVRQFLEFVREGSPSLAETAFQSLLAAELGKLGIAAENDGTGRDGAGNLFAVLPGTNRAIAPVLFCMHTDTVEPGLGISPRIEDGWIRSDGTTVLGADNKAAICASLEAIRWLHEIRAAHGDVELLYTWGEEGAHLGSKVFDLSRVRSRCAFVPDSSGPLGRIITQAPGYTAVRATFRGRAAHAGASPEKGISAIRMAARAIEAMPLGQVDPQTTANLGRIAGGTGRNTVPEMTEMEGEARSLDSGKLEAQVARMRTAMEEAAASFGGQVQVELRHLYDGFQLGQDAAPVRLAVAAARAIGLTPRITSTGGGSDANELNAKGLPAVVLGTGNEDSHSTGERVRVADLVKLAELLAAIVVEAGR